MSLRPGVYSCGCLVMANGVVGLCPEAKSIPVSNEVDFDQEMFRLGCHFHHYEFAPLDENPELKGGLGG